MSRRVHGEEDRSVIDPNTEKVYDGIFNVLDGAKDNTSDTSPLLSLFGKEFMRQFGKRVLIESSYRKQITTVMKDANVNQYMPYENAIGALNAHKTKISLNSSLKKYEKNNYLKAIEYAKKFFTPGKKSVAVQK